MVAEDFETVRLRTMELISSETESGKLDGRFSARFDVADGQVRSCNAGDCAEPGTQTPATDLSDYSPVASPDGSQVAFLHGPRFNITGTGGVAIHVADLTTGSIRVVMSDAHGYIGDSSLAWSPDGRWLAFVSRYPDFRDVFVVPADGTSLRRRAA